ncbi:hypothetical protein HBI24_048000 [Parastagonospora nodorum]|nr:hypothetical protein HBH46_087390 [Parastagonospora nodorum]KAH4208825.1 hypothetical protein HBI95_095880 [Parastagonospora nodorum]KAH4970055.1 hypothetical protein HBI78_039400 [Parastagonospora nodorum]KAH5212916.1 hypothetical protein HBH77_069080 [Parastagonospora nodorum]KAH5589967.1 hypothetical protein HBI24_048000 [Parastagonospora nodorum]
MLRSTSTVNMITVISSSYVNSPALSATVVRWYVARIMIIVSYCGCQLRRFGNRACLPWIQPYVTTLRPCRRKRMDRKTSLVL